MKRSFIHNLSSSFVMWFDHTLLEQGEAFTNISGQLYTSSDTKYNTKKIYAAPFKQWVYDSSVTNSVIPSGVYNNGNFINRGTNGLKIDFQNGRAIFDSGTYGEITSNYSVKDFNIYRTNKSDEILVLETKYDFNPRFGQINNGLPPNSIVGPCVFIKLNHFENEGFEFGGTNETTVYFRCIVISQDEYGIDGVGNIFVDQRYKNFAIFDGYTPLNQYGDLKTGSFNYKQESCDKYDPSYHAYIDSVDFSKLIEVDTRTLNPDMEVGFLDFEIKVVRTK